MSKFQTEHAREMLRLVPSLEALRYELCPSRMSDSVFWSIYFESLNVKLRPKPMTYEEVEDDFVRVGEEGFF